MSPASRERSRADAFDDLIARIGNGVDGVAEADDDFLALPRRLDDVGLGFIGAGVAFLDFEGEFVGSAVFGPAQGADAAGDGGVDVGTGAGDDAGGEGGGVELVLGVEDERGVHGLDPASSRRRSPCSRCRKCPPMESSSVSTVDAPAVVGDNDTNRAASN